MLRLAQPDPLHPGQQLVSDRRKVIDVVDHPQRQSIETRAVQALHRFHRVVIAADQRKTRTADEPGLQLFLVVGRDPGVDPLTAEIECVVGRLPVALLVDDVVVVILRLLAGAPDHQVTACEDVAQLSRRRGVAKDPELRLQIFMLGRHRREQTIRVARGEIAAGLRIPRTDENRPAAPPWLRLRHHRLQFVVVTIEVERLVFGPDAFDDGQPLLAVVIASVMVAQRDAHHAEFDRIPAGDDVEPESPVADVIRRDHLLGGKNRIDERDVERPKSRNVFRRSQ